MLKASTGTDRSLQIVTWASTAWADELFTETSVVSPFGLLRSTSKYGSSSVAAGETSMLQRVACAGTARTMSESTARSTRHFINAPPPDCASVRERRRVGTSYRRLNRKAAENRVLPWSRG